MALSLEALTSRDQITRRIANGEQYLDINLDDFQAYDPIHQDMFQQAPGLYFQAVTSPPPLSLRLVRGGCETAESHIHPRIGSPQSPADLFQQSVQHAHPRYFGFP